MFRKDVGANLTFRSSHEEILQQERPLARIGYAKARLGMCGPSINHIDVNFAGCFVLLAKARRVWPAIYRMMQFFSTRVLSPRSLRAFISNMLLHPFRGAYNERNKRTFHKTSHSINGLYPSNISCPSQVPSSFPHLIPPPLADYAISSKWCANQIGIPLLFYSVAAACGFTARPNVVSILKI